MFNMEKLNEVLSATSSLSKNLNKLRTEIEKLKQEKELLETLPACKEDIIEYMDAYIDSQGSLFPSIFSTSLEPIIRRPLDEFKAEKDGGAPIPVVNAVKDRNSLASLKSVQANLFFLFGDQIKKSLRDVIENLDIPESGPKRSIRLKEITKIDFKLAEMERMEQEIEVKAKKGGVRI